MIPEELMAKLYKAKESKQDLVLTETEVAVLMCTLYFYRELFKKFNLSLDQGVHGNEREFTRPE